MFSRMSTYWIALAVATSVGTAPAQASVNARLARTVGSLRPVTESFKSTLERHDLTAFPLGQICRLRWYQLGRAGKDFNVADVARLRDMLAPVGLDLFLTDEEFAVVSAGGPAPAPDARSYLERFALPVRELAPLHKLGIARAADLADWSAVDLRNRTLSLLPQTLARARALGVLVPESPAELTAARAGRLDPELGSLDVFAPRVRLRLQSLDLFNLREVTKAFDLPGARERLGPFAFEAVRAHLCSSRLTAR